MRTVYFHLVVLFFLSNVGSSALGQLVVNRADSLLSPTAMRRDLAVMQASWQSVHGGLYRYITPQQLTAEFNRLDSLCQNPMRFREFFVRLAQLNIRLRCGHSFVSYYNNKRSLKEILYAKTFLPFLFRMLAQNMVVTHVLDSTLDLRIGDQILAFNGIPASLIRDSLLSVSKSDGNNGRNKQIDNISLYPHDMAPKRYALFDIYYPLLFKTDLHEAFTTVEVKRGKTNIRLRVKNLSKQERYDRLLSYYGPIPQGQETWFLKYINPESVLFRVGDFATYNWKFDFRAYLDSIFTKLRKERVQNLIVDIRQNEGGADDARDAVLAYLTPRNLGPANEVKRYYRYTQVPDSLKPFMDTWDPGFLKDKIGYKAVGNGYFEKENAEEVADSIIAQKHHFEGKIFLLTDVTNSSATFIMADCFKRNKLGIIVGETTGGSRQGINGGELVFLYLPETGIEMDVPLIWQSPKTPLPDEGIIPDHLVPTTWQDLRSGNDPQLSFILHQWIKNKNKR